MQQGDHLFDVQCCTQEPESHQESPPANQKCNETSWEIGQQIKT
jgi:hypothetical protein